MIVMWPLHLIIQKSYFQMGVLVVHQSLIASASDSGVESLAYEVKTIGSSKIIISGVPQMHRELNPDDVPIGGKIMFAAVPTHGMGLVDESTNPTGIRIFNGYFVPLVFHKNTVLILVKKKLVLINF